MCVHAAAAPAVCLCRYPACRHAPAANAHGWLPRTRRQLSKPVFTRNGPPPCCSIAPPGLTLPPSSPKRVACSAPTAHSPSGVRVRVPCAAAALTAAARALWPLQQLLSSDCQATPPQQRMTELPPYQSSPLLPCRLRHAVPQQPAGVFTRPRGARVVAAGAAGNAHVRAGRALGQPPLAGGQQVLRGCAAAGCTGAGAGRTCVPPGPC